MSLALVRGGPNDPGCHHQKAPHRNCLALPLNSILGILSEMPAAWKSPTSVGKVRPHHWLAHVKSSSGQRNGPYERIRRNPGMRASSGKVDSRFKDWRAACQTIAMPPRTRARATQRFGWASVTQKNRLMETPNTQK